MSNRSWFYAANGQQQGPFPEAQLRDFITRGTVRADTLVWSEGMSGWQRAGEIPGLMPAGGAPPVPQPGGPPMGGAYGDAAAYSGGALSIDLPLWGFLGRGIVYVIGFMLIIPAPWVAVWFYKWVASHITVPGRPNFGFAGEVADCWYIFIPMAILTWVGQVDFHGFQYIALLIQAYLSWMLFRWIIANLSSNGEKLPFSFQGSPLVYIGWDLLMYISIITIIGWAWVITAWMRWNCRNIAGTQREVIFNATGLEMLWRTIVFGIGCAFIIPIPWVMRWYTRWYISQFALAERGPHASA